MVRREGSSAELSQASAVLPMLCLDSTARSPHQKCKWSEMARQTGGSITGGIGL